MDNENEGFVKKNDMTFERKNEIGKYFCYEKKKIFLRKN